MNYAELLRDPRWQRKRLEILNRSDFSCEECGAKDRTLNVHHKHYRKGAEPWDYEDDALAALCDECHAEHHRLEKKLKSEIGELSLPALKCVLLLVQSIRLREMSGLGGCIEFRWKE